MDIATKQKKGKFSTQMLTSIVSIVVKKYIKNGYLEASQYEDTRQTVLEKYYAKQDRIESLYDSRAKPETYISAVVYKMLLEILRSQGAKEKHQAQYQKTILKGGVQRELNPEEKLIIENEKRYLQKVMSTFGNKTPKAMLYCKMFFRIKPTWQDIKDYAKENFDEKMISIANISGNELDKEIFARLCEISNIAENKQNKPDAARMFLNKTLESIIARINGNRKANYTEESLQVLFELIYTKNKNM